MLEDMIQAMAYPKPRYSEGLLYSSHCSTVSVTETLSVSQRSKGPQHKLLPRDAGFYIHRPAAFVELCGRKPETESFAILFNL
jgi:hypothetical protein